MTSALDRDTAWAALELAVRAPSLHNTQPWRFRIGAGSVDLFADPTRRLPGTDPDERDLIVSCGAVLHHLRSALAAFGTFATTTRLPDPDRPEHVATLEFTSRTGTHADLETAAAILRRRSDRRAYLPWPVPDDRLAELARGAAAYGTVLRVVRSAGARSRLVSAIAEGEPAGAGTLLVLGTSTDDRYARLRTGEALSSVLLAATAMGLATCPLSQPLELPGIRQAVR